MLNKFMIDPADLAELTEAFEEAWAMIEVQRRIPLIYALAERDRLGQIVLTLWNVDPECDLIAKAVAQFHRTAVPHEAYVRCH
jgi:hypothetical protein